ncbi:MAG: putative RNA-binding protein [Haloquadratum sp. J07HQX50]|nr:MAG: putative RNA-binding protein [Haloquadratum sp. J07HQX50]
MTASESGDSEKSSDDESADHRHAIILDHIPHGQTNPDRPRSQQEPIAYGIEEEDFRLYQLTFETDADVSIGDRVVIGPTEARKAVDGFRQVGYDALSTTGQNELKYAVEEIIQSDEDRFVSFYNEAQPITLRLHQLNLLPGIGKKLRNDILDQRKRGPFSSFSEIEQRITGLHNPAEILAERILEEIRENDLKYNVFVAPSE